MVCNSTILLKKHLFQLLEANFTDGGIIDALTTDPLPPEISIAKDADSKLKQNLNHIISSCLLGVTSSKIGVYVMIKSSLINCQCFCIPQIQHLGGWATRCTHH